VENWNRRPAADSWSVGECIDHLARTARVYVPPLRVAIEKGRARGRLGQGPFRHGRLGNWFISRLEPDAGGRMKTRGNLEPGTDLNPVVVLTEFDTVGEDLFELMAQADGLDLARIKIASPVLPLVRFSLGQVFHLLETHERRHLAQADRALHAILPA